jgi:phosphatidylserine decarboxylase
MSTPTLARRTSPLFRAALHRRPAPPRNRHYSASSRQQQSEQKRDPFRKRLRSALDGTQIVWRPIPIALGIVFLGGFQLYRTQVREQKRIDDEWARRNDDGEGDGRRVRRHSIRPSGPWTVQIMSALPLKALSRIWGQFNSIEIPYSLRIPGFKLYGWVFGVNFDEIEEQDLHNFRNLSEFFYRTIKPGVRPLDPNPNALLSPADGKVVQFGVIEHGDIEQVKGVTYSVDALLGDRPMDIERPTSNIAGTSGAPQQSKFRVREGEEEKIKADEEFARVNGISYDLPSLFSGSAKTAKGKPRSREGAATKDNVVSAEDQSTHSRASSEAAVAADLALSPSAQKPWYYFGGQAEAPTALYYCVVYLAPGDYHRFHSPVSWVVESRRHFAGELYSVSPYLVRNLPGLFTLNERVVLLGKWKHGFFSYTPVGATNVGSIVINFDRELRTNSLLTDTAADHAAAEAQKRGEPYSGYAEATYKSASSILGGHALKRGEEMGGFKLGSTIVMVFEAPKGRRPTLDEGYMGADGTGRKGGFKWCIEKGMHVKVGQQLGYAIEEQE